MVPGLLCRLCFVFGVGVVVTVAQQRCWPAVDVDIDQFGVSAAGKFRKPNSALQMLCTLLMNRYDAVVSFVYAEDEVGLKTPRAAPLFGEERREGPGVWTSDAQTHQTPSQW